MYKFHHHRRPFTLLPSCYKCVVYSICIHTISTYHIYIISVKFFAFNYQAYSILLLLLFFFLAMPCGLWDHSSPIKNWTQATVMKAQNPNHWATRELSSMFERPQEKNAIFTKILTIFVVLHFWYSKFPSYIIFIVWRTSFSNSFRIDMLAMISLNFSL